jgi:hypothetical protein
VALRCGSFTNRAPKYGTRPEVTAFAQLVGLERAPFHPTDEFLHGYRRDFLLAFATQAGLDPTSLAKLKVSEIRQAILDTAPHLRDLQPPELAFTDTDAAGLALQAILAPPLPAQPAIGSEDAAPQVADEPPSNSALPGRKRKR